MSLFSALRTSTSGLSAQSSYLSSIGDNIANSSTVGYKEASTQFETVLGQQTPGSYESGGVLAQTRYNVTDQGTLAGTTSSTDLAINGQGFFEVNQGGSGGTYLTRAGSFSPDLTGNLVNTAGYTLLGRAPGSTDLVPVNISGSIAAQASSSGTITGNLPSTDATDVERANTITLYDSTGATSTATLTYKNQGGGTWSVTATDANGNPLGKSSSLAFNLNTGALTSGSPLTITPLAAGSSPVIIDLTGLTQVAGGFSSTSSIDGSATSTLSSVQISADGTLTGIYGNGEKVALYTIPIATVASPEHLTALSGDVYQVSSTSGPIDDSQTAGTGSAGAIEADNLESSTVDIATELTNLIVAQRAYEANTKVLQAASDLLSKLDQIQTN